MNLSVVLTAWLTSANTRLAPLSPVTWLSACVSYRYDDNLIWRNTVYKAWNIGSEYSFCRLSKWDFVGGNISIARSTLEGSMYVSMSLS
jgi:hypothetical protein